jgi:hypothetical protein
MEMAPQHKSGNDQLLLQRELLQYRLLDSFLHVSLGMRVTASYRAGNTFAIKERSGTNQATSSGVYSNS